MKVRTSETGVPHIEEDISFGGQQRRGVRIGGGLTGTLLHRPAAVRAPTEIGTVFVVISKTAKSMRCMSTIVRDADLAAVRIFRRRKAALVTTPSSHPITGEIGASLEPATTMLAGRSRSIKTLSGGRMTPAGKTRSFTR
jgi:hypothetical protein